MSSPFHHVIGLSQSLMVQEGGPNLDVTLKGYLKKFWGLLDKIAKKHNKSHNLTPTEEVYP